ncbi:uncharacterized protein LOC115390112 [Salarias fasciatus]|uniref:uncharacterized protein LOC115390112 n=1 Tax=Salarias fasciatus TaxID=181472 RepID=UPI001176E6FB|nr:uncharacterized protein LOC115390112 [Salarias fasciatus]
MNGFATAANVSTDMLSSLSKEDLRDLFTGPEHFIRRMAIWRTIHGGNEYEQLAYNNQPHPGTSGCDATSIPTTPTPSTPPSIPAPGDSASRTVQLVCPQFVVYTDTELEQSRTAYFEKQRAGQEGDYTLSKELRCRLIRNTVTSMLAIKTAAEDDFQYPCCRELSAMAKRLIEYYPMLRDRTAASGDEWKSVKKQLLKRVQNVTPPKKRQGATPSRKRQRAIINESSSKESSTDDSGSTASTLILERSPQSGGSSPEAEQLDVPASGSGPGGSSGKRRQREDTPVDLTLQTNSSERPETSDSLQNQARHYGVLQELYKSRPRPNKKDVAQLLDLEYQARRAYINSDVMREQDKPTKILQAYPCFREVDHVIKQAIATMKALPDIFPSPVAPPKKLGHASEAMLHILKSAEDANTFLQTRPLSSPVVIVTETNCILAIGTIPVLTFPKEDISDSVMYIMACYYTFHLTYPKCLATLLSPGPPHLTSSPATCSPGLQNLRPVHACRWRSHCLGPGLGPGQVNKPFKPSPTVSVLMTLMKLRLNLLQEDLLRASPASPASPAVPARPLPLEFPVPRRKRKREQQQDDLILRQMATLEEHRMELYQRLVQGADECSRFGRVVADLLRRVPEDERPELMFRMHSLIHKRKL